MWNETTTQPFVGKIVTFSVFGWGGPGRYYYQMELVKVSTEHAIFEKNGGQMQVPLGLICGIWLDQS